VTKVTCLTFFLEEVPFPPKIIQLKLSPPRNERKAFVARLMRIAVIVACFFGARIAFAAGGTCPSGENYTSPSNPTGSPVTLSSLGITSCYYVSAAGSDSLYDGTSEKVTGSHGPFLHSPGMANCSGNCAAAALSSGLGVIFRGGDTWHFGNSGATPYAGVVTTCADNGNNAAGLCLDDVNATSSNPIYYGVDQAWSAGSTWARPILSADNPLCNGNSVGTLSDGATCSSWTDQYGQPGYYVSNCPYQIGNSNNLVDVGYSKYIYLDNFELTGLCMSHANQPSNFDDYVAYGSAQAPLYFLNLYIHGASHLQFGAYNSDPRCHGVPLVCTNMSAFAGSVNNGSVGETVAFVVVDFSDSDPVGQWICYGGFYNAAYNVFNDSSNCLPNTLHLFHDNLYENFFENGHSNMLEDIEETPGVNAIYNNIFIHVEHYVTSGGGVFLWPSPPSSGVSDYIFNNVGYDVGALEYFNFGGTAGDNASGNYVLFNNTWQSNAQQPIVRCASYSNGSVLEANDHSIDDQNPVQGGCATYKGSTNLWQSNTSALSGTATGGFSNANSSPHFDQFTSSQVYAYSPAASTNSTVGTGTNEQSYCSALSTAANSDATLSNAASACQNPIPYVCGYVTSTHSVFCHAPATASPVAVARPASAAWNIGAYQLPATTPGSPKSAAAAPTTP
jgi:hypothetical protein